jgi:hypothetical protein
MRKYPYLLVFKDIKRDRKNIYTKKRWCFTVGFFVKVEIAVTIHAYFPLLSLSFPRRNYLLTYLTAEYQELKDYKNLHEN